MKKIFLPVSLFAVALLLPLTALAKDNTLSLQKTAPYAKDLMSASGKATSCELETKIPLQLQAAAKRQYGSIELVEDASKVTTGAALAAKITGIAGAGGGAWSGPKFVTITGTLWEDGKVKGTFTATRYTGGGAFGGYNTCQMLGRCIKSIGKDVGKWLDKPTMDAMLGDAK